MRTASLALMCLIITSCFTPLTCALTAFSASRICLMPYDERYLLVLPGYPIVMAKSPSL